MKKIIAIASAIALLSGCSSITPQERIHTVEVNRDIALAYYASQMRQADMPLVKMEAQEGQTIQLVGVKSFEVYAPRQAGNERGMPMLLPAPKDEIHPMMAASAQILATAVPVVGSVLAQGWAMKGLADVVGRNNASIASSGFDAVRDIGTSNTTSLTSIVDSLTRNPSTTYNVTGSGNMFGDGNIWDQSRRYNVPININQTP
jgi:hypothetical protein